MALLNEVLSSLPPEWEGDPLLEIQAALKDKPGKLVVLDDDPTGTQTVHDITVVTCWDVDTLREALSTRQNGFYVLTNSRALTEDDSKALHREILANLKTAANGTPLTIVSRSDSTLRGHFPAETDTIDKISGPFDLTVVAPFFEAGGRLTIDDTHYVVEGGELVPAHETPFAQDKVFGYQNAYLPAWVEEKTRGKVAANSVISIDLQTIRLKGPNGVRQSLEAAPRGSVCIANAVTQRDMEVFAAGALQFESTGRSILYRSAAALAAARLGLKLQPPLEEGFAIRRTDSGGLIVAGSYVPKTTEQLQALDSIDTVEKIELDVAALLELADESTLIEELSRRLNETLHSGKDALLFTSRKLVSTDDDKENLSIGRRVSDTLIKIVRNLQESPRFIIAKGGITSSDVATKGLEIRVATIIGQLIPGVPIWRSQKESRFPDLDLVVFPGNVGGPQALREAYEKISGT